MKKTTLIFGSLITGALLAGWAAQAAIAQGGWGGPGGHRGGPRAELMYEALDLTVEQRQAIEDIRANYRPQLRALRAGGRDNRRALRETAPDDPNYATVVAEASQAAAEQASQLVLITAEMRREIHALLTPEQRAKSQELRDTMRGKFEERMERRRARGRSADEA